MTLVKDSRQELGKRAGNEGTWRREIEMVCVPSAGRFHLGFAQGRHCIV